MQARSKKVRRSVRTLHLRIFTNRDEEEYHGDTDDRSTACGLPDTPHHLAEQRIAPDCHINVFSSEAMRRITLLKSTNVTSLEYKICKTCKKRVEFMTSLGGFA